MKKKNLSRRKFIGKIAAGTAGVAAICAAPKVSSAKRMQAARPRLGALSRPANPHVHLLGPAGGSAMRPPYPRPQWHALGYGLDHS